MTFWEYIIQVLKAKHGSTTPAVRCPPYTGPGTLRGIGVDYNWLGVNYEKGFRMLAQAGCNATSIEFFGWSGSYDINRGLGPLKDPYKRVLEAARKYGGIVFNSLLNDNQGNGKYGDKRKRWSKYAGLANEALDFCISLGPEGHWIQPVAETGSEWGKAFEQTAIARLNAAGIVSVYNRGSRPTAPACGAKRNAYHPFQASDMGTPDDIIVTDTGKMVGWFLLGGIYGSEVNDDAARIYAKAVCDAGKRDLLIYTFTGVKMLDEGAARAMGEAWK